MIGSLGYEKAETWKILSQIRSKNEASNRLSIVLRSLLNETWKHISFQHPEITEMDPCNKGGVKTIRPSNGKGIDEVYQEDQKSQRIY